MFKVEVVKVNQLVDKVLWTGRIIRIIKDNRMLVNRNNSKIWINQIWEEIIQWALVDFNRVIVITQIWLLISKWDNRGMPLRTT